MEQDKILEIYEGPMGKVSETRGDFTGALAGFRDERIRQARIIFNVATCLAAAGGLVVVSGVILVIAGVVQGGGLASLVGVLTQGISAVLFRLNKQTNDRLDEVAVHLTDQERLDKLAQLVDSIADAEKRDEAILELLKPATRSRS